MSSSICSYVMYGVPLEPYLRANVIAKEQKRFHPKTGAPVTVVEPSLEVWLFGRKVTVPDTDDVDDLEYEKYDIALEAVTQYLDEKIGVDEDGTPGCMAIVSLYKSPVGAIGLILNDDGRGEGCRSFQIPSPARMADVKLKLESLGFVGEPEFLHLGWIE